MPRLHRLAGLVMMVAMVMTAMPPAVRADDGGGLFHFTAPTGLLLDEDTGTVLAARDPDMKVPPASLAKLMTALVVFKAVKLRRISLDTMYHVSEHAWRTGGAPAGGSTMFAAIKSDIAVSDLLRGLIVQAGNDAAIILAEGLEGSEAAFTERMNAEAAELGLTNTHFGNPAGLPDPDAYITMRDAVTLARHIHDTYPDLFRIYSEPDFTWNGIFQRNRNPLLRADVGADGMATGYTENAGYAVVGTAQRFGRRIYLAMSGMDSEAARETESSDAINWALGAFREREMFAAGKPIASAEVYGGAMSEVAMTSPESVRLLVPTGEGISVTVEAIYDAPLPAPIAKGEQIGTLRVSIGDTMAQEVPLVAAEDIALGKLSERARGALYELAVGWMR